MCGACVLRWGDMERARIIIQLGALVCLDKTVLFSIYVVGSARAVWPMCALALDPRASPQAREGEGEI